MTLPSSLRPAFTLLEMLVVLLALGVLVGLALPRFVHVQDRAYQASMKSDLRNFALERALYLSERDGVPEQVAELAGFAFSAQVYELGYQSDSAEEWTLAVGHHRSETVCALSARAEAGTRIHCETEAPVAFAANPQELTIHTDATSAVEESAFAPSPQLLALQAALKRKEVEMVSWSWGDGTVTTGTVEEWTLAKHTYRLPGKYKVRLVLVGEDGSVEQGEQTVDVVTPEEEVLNQAPVAHFQVETASPVAGSPVQFNAALSTDTDGDALSYQWNFGDKTTGTGVAPSKTYTSAGTYTVVLTVSDGQASHSISGSLLVADEAAVLMPSFYVDAEAGNDENPGTQAAPFRTLARGARELRPGVALLLRRGSHFQGENLTVASDSVFIGAYGTGAAPVVDGNNRSSSGGNGVVLWGRRQVVVEELEVREWGVAVYVASSRNITLRRLRVADNWYSGVGFTRGVQASLVEEVVASNTAFNGLAIDGRNGASTGNTFRRIESYGNFTGIKVFDGASGNHFQDLYLYDNGLLQSWENGQTTSSANMSFTGASHDNTLERALILRGGAGVETRDSDRIRIRQATIRNTANAGLSFKFSGSGSVVENVTLFDNQGGLYIVPEYTGITFRNVVVVGARGYGVQTSATSTSPVRLRMGSSCVTESGKGDVSGLYQDAGGNRLGVSVPLVSSGQGWLSVSGGECVGRGYQP